jgi:predicted acetyltransferase
VAGGSVTRVNLRLLTEADAASSTLISQHAFGLPTDGRPAFTIGPEMRRWGIFDGETLVAKANDRAYDSWIGGCRVPTAGVAGVVVAPEYRGAGLARQVMTHLLHAARDRGAVIATLFRTAPALYRSLGFEQVAELVDGSLPTSALRGIRPAHTTLRRATAEDATSIRNIYARVAASGSCLLARDGAAFEVGDRELIAATDGVTLAIDENGGAVGYVSWNRGSGYGGSATLSVVDLQAVTGDGYRALLSAVGSFDAVTPTVRIRTSGTDPIHWLIPGAGWSVSEVSPYMLRVIDLAGAVAARGWPTGLTAEIDLEVEDPLCPWNSGSHRLVLRGGTGHLEDLGGGSPEHVGVESGGVDAAATAVTLPGLALLYAGGVTSSALRRTGLITGGSAGSDTLLDAAFAGPRPAVLDYF